MKSNILKILLIITCLVFMADGFAQKTFKQSDLVNKRWKTGKHTIYHLKYTKTKETLMYREDMLIRTNQCYYLSDSPDTVFDMSKVGKSSSGRYIIINYPKKSKTFIKEILLLTNNTLIYRNYPWATFFGNNGILVYHTVNYRKNKQQKFQMSDIAGRKWARDTLIGYPRFFMEFQNNEKLTILDSSINWVNSKYYLSDKIDTVFDTSKVGNNTSGRYIIGLDSENRLLTYEILRLDNNRLIIKDLYFPYGNGIIPLHLVE